MNEMKLHVTGQDPKGGTWSHQGTRPELETWIVSLDNPADMSFIITDETGITIGRKHFGEKTITWGAALAKE